MEDDIPRQVDIGFRCYNLAKYKFRFQYDKKEHQPLLERKDFRTPG